jgi:hypothetical protein
MTKNSIARPTSKTITWTPNAFLSSLGHDTGFSTSEGFNKEKVHQDWTSYHCQYLGLTIPHLAEFKHHECPCKRFAIDDFGDHLHTCTQHAGATSGAHEHILTALQRLFTKAGYRTDRKHVPHSRGLKKADLLIKDFQLQGVRDVIVDVTCRHEFRGSCANQERNGEPSHLDVNGALDAAVKEKLDHYQHDYNERNFFFLPAVTTTSGRISGDFLRLLYILSHRQAANYFTRMGIIDPSPQAFKQRRGSYFYYNRAAIGLACAQATAMRSLHTWLKFLASRRAPVFARHDVCSTNVRRRPCNSGTHRRGRTMAGEGHDSMTRVH